MQGPSKRVGNAVGKGVYMAQKFTIKVGGVGMQGPRKRVGNAVGKGVLMAQKFGHYGPPAAGCWVSGVECTEEGRDRGNEFLASRNQKVKGALFEMVPKQCSKMAHGIFDTVRCQWCVEWQPTTWTADWSQQAVHYAKNAGCLDIS
jgi:hypothetical protein